MTFKDLHAFLAKQPKATLSVQWGNDYVYKVGGKMFAVLDSPPDGNTRSLSFSGRSHSSERRKL
jgi:predicted DNA-binding protein (MmcQ/YjbR family)